MNTPIQNPIRGPSKTKTVWAILWALLRAVIEIAIVMASIAALAVWIAPFIGYQPKNEDFYNSLYVAGLVYIIRARALVVEARYVSRS